MIKAWATVISWSNGIAEVHCEAKAACHGCPSRIGCNSQMMLQNRHTITIASKQPLSVGQKVELGITESRLLASAMLVYSIPLAGLLLMAFVFQYLFAHDFASLCGAILGGGSGFWLSHRLAGRGEVRQFWQPVIISVGLPPDLLHIEKNYSGLRQ